MCVCLSFFSSRFPFSSVPRVRPHRLNADGCGGCPRVPTAAGPPAHVALAVLQSFFVVVGSSLFELLPSFFRSIVLPLSSSFESAHLVPSLFALSLRFSLSFGLFVKNHSLLPTIAGRSPLAAFLSTLRFWQDFRLAQPRPPLAIHISGITARERQRLNHRQLAQPMRMQLQCAVLLAVLVAASAGAMPLEAQL